ncbi:hypothetical protein VTI28DRAFT_1358 [Corynascus sepedonium]
MVADLISVASGAASLLCRSRSPSIAHSGVIATLLLPYQLALLTKGMLTAPYVCPGLAVTGAFPQQH